MDSPSSKRGGSSQGRQVGSPTQGIWAALSPHPASSPMSKVCSLQNFRELEYDRKILHGQHPAVVSPTASSFIEAAPGYRYHQYQMHEQGDGVHRCHGMRHVQSAPMDVLAPLQWSCRKQRRPEREERWKCKNTDEEEEEEEEEEELETQRERTCRDCSGEEKEEEEEKRLPPHELLAREWAASTSSGGAAFSLRQGVGRTLKGHDLRRVRNAILKQTGFI